MVGFYNYTVILTYIGLLSAVTGVCLASVGNPSAAIVCLMVSGFCDLFDGSIAKTRKRTAREKKFGIQIDSLTDLVCFGVLPAAIAFSIGLTRWFEILLAAVYVLAALIRLAYYNVTEDELQAGGGHRTSYEGMPVTTAALGFPLCYALRYFLGDACRWPYLAFLALLAAAFVIKIPVKKLGMPGMIAAACVGLGVLALLILGW